MAWQEPKIDWAVNPKNPTNEDMNRIEGNIAQLKTDIETKKGAIVDAVNNIGGNTSIEKTYQEIADEINSLKLSGDALASQVLPGRTFYNTDPKNKLTGTMPTKGAQTYTPGTTDQTIAAGQYLSGTQTIKGDSNLKAANIIKGKSIFGVTGTTEALADTQLFVAGNTSYLNWEKIGNGTVTITSSSIRLTPGWDDYATAVTKNRVNLSDVKAIVAFVKVTEGGNGTVRLGADVSKFIVTSYTSGQPAYKANMLDLYPDKSNVPTGEFLMLLDVNQLTGLHYIYLFSNLANNEHTEYFYNVQLIK